MTQKEYFEFDNNVYDQLLEKGVIELTVSQLGNGKMQCDVETEMTIDEFISKNSLFIINPDNLPNVTKMPSVLEMSLQNEFRHVVISYHLLPKTRNFWMSRDGLRNDKTPQKTIIFIDGYTVLSDVSKTTKDVAMNDDLKGRIKAAQKMESVIDDIIKGKDWTGIGSREFKVFSDGSKTEVWLKNGDVEYHKFFDKDGNEVIPPTEKSEDAAPTGINENYVAKDEDTAEIEETVHRAESDLDRAVKGLHKLFGL